MKISVTYAEATKQRWIQLDVPDKTTVEEAIQRSGLLEAFPEIDLERNKFGVFGKIAKPSQLLREGDRVEIYRPITADPETVERRDIE